MTLLNAIPYGKENARSRAEIVRLTGIPDRNMRDEVKKLNTELAKYGEAILSSSAKKGYWRTDDITEMEAYIKELRRRQNNLLKNASPIIKLIYKARNTKYTYVKPHMRRVNQKEESTNQITF